MWAGDAQEIDSKTDASYASRKIAIHVVTSVIQNGIIEECLNLMKIIGISAWPCPSTPSTENDKTIDVKRGICQSIGLQKYNKTAISSTAYKELMPILEESMNKESSPSDETMKRCAAALETATWQYTRKQNTWIRNRIKSETDVKVVHIDTTGELFNLET